MTVLHRSELGAAVDVSTRPFLIDAVHREPSTARPLTMRASSRSPSSGPRAPQVSGGAIGVAPEVDAVLDVVGRLMGAKIAVATARRAGPYPQSPPRRANAGEVVPTPLVGRARPPARPRPEACRVQSESQVGPVGAAGRHDAHLDRDVIASVEPSVEQAGVDELDFGQQQARPNGEQAKAQQRWVRAGHASTVRHYPTHGAVVEG